MENVLYLQDRHISNNITAENMDALIPPRRSDKSLWMLKSEGIHTRVRICLSHMGLYGILQCGPIKYYDNHLLTAMVERWHRETHTFHLPVGEATITLQDVAMIWGLNIDGIPITGMDNTYSKEELQQRCLYWLGFLPAPNQIKGGHLYLTALRQHCHDHMIEDDSTEEDVARYSRCVALMIIGGCLFPDSESAAVKLMYLQFVEDIDRVHTYSWGSAVLAYLYRELCSASMGLKVDLCGPVQILQIWVWSRITLLCPERLDRSTLTPEQSADMLQGLPMPPYGALWKRGFTYVHTVCHSVRTMRDMIDRMVDGQFRWIVYDMESPEATRLLGGNRYFLCRSACPLINFDIIEMHRPERCLRQFGMCQGIPPAATNYDKLHKLSRRGRSNFDWATFHKDLVDMWNDRYNFVVGGEFITPGTPHTTADYIGWYRGISRIRISPTVVPTNMVGYHPIDASHQQFWEQSQPRNYASMSHNVMSHQQSREQQSQPGNYASMSQNVMSHQQSREQQSQQGNYDSMSQSYDHGYHTPLVGGFTQFLRSDYRPFVTDLRPRLNASPIPFQDYSHTQISDVTSGMVGTSSTAAEPQTEGVEEELLGRGRRRIFRPDCGTGGHRFHYRR